MIARFNGAALFQVRKGFRLLGGKKREAVLQWGRTLSSAESCLRARLPTDLTCASMGPHSFKCGKLRTPNSIACVRACASMGPHSFKCGKFARKDTHMPKTAKASMGPHSFKCGKKTVSNNGVVYSIRFNGAALFQVRKVPERKSKAVPQGKLQWGRTLSSAERGADGCTQAVAAHGLQWGRTLSSAERMVEKWLA